MADPVSVAAFDLAFAAMCIIEEIVAPANDGAGEPWDAYRQRVGINEVRGTVINCLAADCDKAWTRTNRLYEEAYERYQIAKAESGDGTTTVPAPNDPGSFDYEFVPFWLRNAVDWSDTETGPRVRGS